MKIKIPRLVKSGEKNVNGIRLDSETLDKSIERYIGENVYFHNTNEVCGKIIEFDSDSITIESDIANINEKGFIVCAFSVSCSGYDSEKDAHIVDNVNCIEIVDKFKIYK